MYKVKYLSAKKNIKFSDREIMKEEYYYAACKNINKV